MSNHQYTTIAKMKLVYNGVSYDYTFDFEQDYPLESAFNMFNDGNFACDCNRSLFLQKVYGDCIKELDCGHTIEMKDFEAYRIKVEDINKPILK